MKRTAMVVCIMLSMGCSGNRVMTKRFPAEHILPVAEFQKLDGVANYKNYISYIDKGDTFPIEIIIDDDLIDLKQKTIDVAAKQKLFFMVNVPDDLSVEEMKALEKLNGESMASMSDEDREKLFHGFMLYISKDSVTWAPLHNKKALKKVLGIKGGSIAFGFGMNKRDGVKSVLTIKTIKE